MKKIPIVAIVGRANVGKSSLFNAVLGRREAIVAREAGTTRDAIAALVTIDKMPRSSHLDVVQGASEQRTEPYTRYGEGAAQIATQQNAKSRGRVAGSAGKPATAVRGPWNFWIVDTAGMKSPEDDFELTIQEQISEATLNADLIWVVIEAHTVITDEDRRVAKLALKTKKPVILVTNKIDRAGGAELEQFQKLGIKNIIATSTTQGRGIDELLEQTLKQIPKAKAKPQSKIIKTAILGRPNVGKSSLFNTLIKKQKAIVATVAGTTRDVNREALKYHNQEIELMDTAGIRRSGKIERGVERFSVLRAISAIEEADVCLLVMEVNELNVALDQKIAGMVKEAGKGLILIVSKWDDFHDKTAHSRDLLAAQIAAHFEFVPWARLIFTSSISGQNVAKIFDLISEVYKNRQTKIKTSELNQWLGEVTAKHTPAGLKNSNPKLNYIVQEQDNPEPTFKIYGRDARLIHFSYKRYLEKALRNKYGFEGSPIKFWFFNKD